MTQLDTYESALFLSQLALAEVDGKPELRAQLASIRLRRVVEALQGNVDLEAYEAKILGKSA